MQLEIEQKYPVDDLQQVRKTLEALGATIESPICQVDLYFRHPVRNFVQTDEALRLRQVGEENFITYKGPKIDAETKTRREIELPLEPGRHGPIVRNRQRRDPAGPSGWPGRRGRTRPRAPG